MTEAKPIYNEDGQPLRADTATDDGLMILTLSLLPKVPEGKTIKINREWESDRTP